MDATTVAVDWAKSVFQLAVADDAWRVVETHRLTRTQFERRFANREVSLVIMEACGSNHHWRAGSPVWVSRSSCCRFNTCWLTSSATRPPAH